jgi:Zn-dependent protease
MNETLYKAAALIVPLIIAIVFHEVAHGWVARWFGDDTAARQGRLTFNPIKHVDPVGTVILPGILALSGAPVFGWAKPVPVNTNRLRNPRLHMMAVAAAGPGMNLLLGLVAALALGVVMAMAGPVAPGPVLEFIATSLVLFLSINIFLALFNLLPIPPFDGSYIISGLLPPHLAAGYEKLRPYGLLLLVGLLLVLPVLVPQLNLVGRLVGPPVDWLMGQYVGLSRLIAGV